MDPVHLLIRNAAAQITFTMLLGWLMLIPRQRRQPEGRLHALLKRDFTAAHVDWLMLAFMQLGAAFLFSQHRVSHGRLIAVALVFGGWVNPVPYAMRAFGVNAFRLGGDWKQALSALLSATSSLALTVAWVAILVEVWRP